MPVAGRQRRVRVALSHAVARFSRSARTDRPDGWLPPRERAGYEEPTPAVEPVNRSALWVRMFAGASVGAILMTLAVPAAEALAVIPTTPDVGSAVTARIPVCAPGQESTATSGSGTPAPLGNLEGLPDDVAGGGTFAGIALDAEQVKMAATVIAVGKQMGMTRRGVEIGVAVATQQSSLRPEAVNGEWLGLFQQNPVTYTQYRRTEPAGAAWMFYDQLIKQVPGYDTDPRSDDEIGEVVQKTRTGWRFAQYSAMAAALADRLMDKVTIAQDEVVCAPAPAQQAATGSAFDPGNIVSDAVFYNSSAMSVEAIRTFLLSEGEGCTGAWCLKNLRISTPGQPADQYCQAYAGGTNEDAATVIAKFSTACGINPQVMLVTLQKESGLLSRTDTTAGTYNAAWGWHCPDTGPGGSANCDPAYAGFFNQGYGMAKQWARYRVDPGKYNYRAGQTVNILWNVVESGCGGAPVTIKNQATASLYNYTPYQPNAAALAAYPGTGDACSAYGNRNFFFLFRKYFGSTGGGASTTTVNAAVRATGTVVQVPNSPYVSAALAGQAITAPTPQVAAGLAAGFSALGLPYVWGGGGSGAGPNNGCARGGGDYNSCGAEIGFDCSGLTAYVLGMAGYQTPGDSGSQRGAGVSVSWSDALPGDIVGFPGHVAIYLGTFGGRPYILEASWVGTPVHIVPLTRTDMDDRVHRYWTGSPVRTTGVADFASLVRINSYGTPNYSSGSTAWFGDLISRPAGGTTFTPNIPRIRPRPFPAPAPVVVLPVPDPAPQAPPTTTIEQPPVTDGTEPATSAPVIAGPTTTAAPTTVTAAPTTGPTPTTGTGTEGGGATSSPTSTGSRSADATPPGPSESPGSAAGTSRGSATVATTKPTPSGSTTPTSPQPTTHATGSSSSMTGATSSTPVSGSPATASPTAAPTPTSAAAATPSSATTSGTPQPATTTDTAAPALSTVTSAPDTEPAATQPSETTQPTETMPDTPTIDGSVAAIAETTTTSEAGSSPAPRTPGGPSRSADLWSSAPRSRRSGRERVTPAPAPENPAGT